MTAILLGALLWFVLAGGAAVLAGRRLATAEAGARAGQRATDDLLAFPEADLRGDATAAGPLR